VEIIRVAKFPLNVLGETMTMVTPSDGLSEGHELNHKASLIGVLHQDYLALALKMTSFRFPEGLGPNYKSKLELKSNSSEILPVNYCKLISESTPT